MATKVKINKHGAFPSSKSLNQTSLILASGIRGSSMMLLKKHSGGAKPKDRSGNNTLNECRGTPYQRGGLVK